MIFSYKNTAHINNDRIVKTAKSLKPYVTHLNEVARWNNYQFLESSINLPLDEPLVGYISDLKKKLVSPKLKYIIDIGIGGSSLGTKAVYDALYGYFESVEPQRFPKMIFVDTNDSAFIYKLSAFIDKIEDPEEILINAVSKSGTTTEAVSNLEILLKKSRELKDRLVITTEFDSPLWNAALGQGIYTLPIPAKVGGRYSVFSAVGLFPLACLNVNISDLLEGALDIRTSCLSSDVLKNPAILSAVAIYLNYKRGKTIHDTFLFHPELESLGKWYRQLVGESVGKDGVGITPTVSIGSNDLHSVYQLYLGGPEDKFFTFVSSLGHEKALSIPMKPLMSSLPIELIGKSTQQIMDAIFESVKQSYVENNIPFVEIELKNIDARSLGKFMQLKMLEVMYLAQLLKVNAFDQPNVELYKSKTHKALNG